MRVRTLLTACIVSVLACAVVRGEDRIVVAPPDTSGEVIIRGEIVDFVGSTIRIRADGSSNPQVVPVSQVVRIETMYLSEHQTGLIRLNEGLTREAEEAFLAAYQNEARGWVRREILAHLVQCAQRREDHVTAASRFIEIIRDDPQSRFWGIAPVPWTPESTSDALKEEARVWLGRSFDVDRFLGACWLLFDNTSHEAALTTLRDFSRGSNTRISALATAQQWRLRLRESNPSDVELASWRDHIEFIPADFRSGPQALLAMGYHRRGQYEQAAAEWLWISTVYTEQGTLAAKATFESADCLDRLGRTEEAARLFTETVERYPWSPQASVARQRLTAMQAESTR